MDSFGQATFVRDKLGRIIQEIYPDSNIITYTYDAVGNRQSMKYENPCVARPIPTITSSNGSSFCKGDSVVLTSSTALHYKWSTGDTTQSIVVKDSGNYSVTTTGTLHCQKKSKAFKITIYPLPNPKIDTSGITAICKGLSVTLSSSISGKYMWNTSDTSKSIIVNATGSFYVVVTDIHGCSGTSPTKNVTVNSLPIVTITGDSIVCANSLHPYLAGSTGNTYKWTIDSGAVTSGVSTNKIGVTWNNAVSGLVKLKETNSNGCSDSAKLKISINPLPIVKIILPTPICPGSSISLGGTSASKTTYRWTSNPSGFTSTSSNPSVSPITTTKYYVTDSIASTGCFKSDSVVVTVKAVLSTPTAFNNGPLCVGDSLKLTTALVSGATYNWTGPNSFKSSAQDTDIKTIGTSDSGKYYLSVIVNGCQSPKDSTNAVVNKRPKPSINGLGTVCSASNQAYSSGSTGNIYKWTIIGGTITSGSGTNKINVLWGSSGAGSVKLVETNSSGCSDSIASSITIKSLPSATVRTASSICNGDSIQIGAASVSGSTYSWKTNPHGFTSSASNPKVAPLSTTKYILTENTTATGCSDSDSVTITVNPHPTPSMGKTHSMCESATMTYVTPNNAGSSYVWTTSGGKITAGAGTNSVSVSWGSTGLGFVQVVEKNTYGCEDSNSADIRINANPKAKIKVTRACLGNITQFTNFSSLDSTQIWYFGDGDTSLATNPKHTYTKANTYLASLVAMSDSGCFDSTSIIDTVDALPNAHWTVKNIGGNSRAFLADDTTMLSAMYQWNFGDTFTSSNFKTTHVYSKDSIYKVELMVKNSRGCSALFDSSIRIIITEIIQTVPDVYSLKIYPNPFKDQINFSFTILQEEHLKVIISDMTGREIAVVADQNFSIGVSSFTLNTQKYSIAVGAYFVKVFYKGNIMTKQIIKVR